MIKEDWIKETLAAKVGVDMDYTLEWDAYRFLIFNKMFAMLGYNKQQEKVLTLKLQPQEGATYREIYSYINEGYYMNKVHWISIRYEKASKELLLELMDKSYDHFLHTLNKKQQAQLASCKRVIHSLDYFLLLPNKYHIKCVLRHVIQKSANDKYFPQVSFSHANKLECQCMI